PLIENNVICDVPENISAWHTNLSVPGNNLESIWVYIRQNPSQFLLLAGLKFISYWGMTRSYYAQSHNMALMFFFYPIYFFAIIGIWKLFEVNKYFAVYVISIFTVFTLCVMVTCDDWNNRFNMPIIPFVILAASFGIKH